MLPPYLFSFFFAALAVVDALPPVTAQVSPTTVAQVINSFTINSWTELPNACLSRGKRWLLFISSSLFWLTVCVFSAPACLFLVSACLLSKESNLCWGENNLLWLAIFLLWRENNLFWAAINLLLEKSSLFWRESNLFSLAACLLFRKYFPFLILNQALLKPRKNNFYWASIVCFRKTVEGCGLVSTTYIIA